MEARRRAEALRGIMGELKGLSANAAAAELNRRGVLAARGGRWTAKQVYPSEGRLHFAPGTKSMKHLRQIR